MSGSQKLSEPDVFAVVWTSHMYHLVVVGFVLQLMQNQLNKVLLLFCHVLAPLTPQQWRLLKGETSVQYIS